MTAFLAHQSVIDSTLELTVDYAFARYPDVAERVPYEEYSEEIARDKFRTAKRVFESLREFYQDLLEKEDG